MSCRVPETVLKQRHQLFVCLLAGADGIVIVCACVTAWIGRRLLFGQPIAPLDRSGELRTWLLEPLVLFTVPAALVSMRVFGLYRPWRDRRMLVEFKHILHACFATIIALIVLIWAVGAEQVGGWHADRRMTESGAQLDGGRLQIGVLAVILPVLLAFERAVFRAVLRAVRRRGWNQRHVAVVGTGRLGRIACRTLDRNSWTGIHVAYFVDHHEQAQGAGTVIDRPVTGGVRDIERLMEERPVDAVYLCLPNSRAALMPDLLRRLERFPVDVRIVPDVNPRYVPLSMSINELEGMPILSVRENPMSGFAGVMKRGVDVLGAGLGLVFFAPVLGVIACIIRATSPGPVIFKQRRVSLGGEQFDILKFRTMRHAEDEVLHAAWTTRDDPRITTIGRWLRRSSLDELPQLINVLLGEMSLVGPRPERPELINRFREDWRGYMLRQHVKAGITGWAQVNGHRGDTSLRKRLQHDLFYIRHWSLGFDLKILWLTLLRGFVHRNAH